MNPEFDSGFEVIFTVKTWWGTALFHIRSLVCKYQLHVLLNKHFVQHVLNMREKNYFLQQKIGFTALVWLLLK